MARLPKQLFDELASLIELEDGTFAGLEEEADLQDGRVVLGNRLSDQAFGGFVVGRLEELDRRGLIDYGPVIKIRDRGREVIDAAGGPDPPDPMRSDLLQALQHIDLHSLIEPRIRRAFEHDDPQQAIAEAFLGLEVHLRQALVARGHTPRSNGLRDMAAHAFAQDGPLSDPARNDGERDGVKYLFFGAAGAIRNRNAHDRPTYDTDEALRLVLFADHLLRLIDTAPGTPA